MSAIDQDFVRDLIERHSDASGGNGRDFHNGAYVAIANELNSTLSSCNCSNSERTNEPCLPHFWTHDGVLHIELPKLPDSIKVRLPDQRDREVRSARTWQYTLGEADATRERQGDAETCHDKNGFDFMFGFECTVCGAMTDGYMVTTEDTGHFTQFNFCPNCGAKVMGMEVDE